MRKIIIAIMLIAPIALMAQKGNYTLSGKVGNINSPAKVYLSYTTAKGAIIDSMLMQNGQFVFKGAVNDPVKAILFIIREGSGTRDQTNDRLTVYLEQGTINVNSTDSLQKAKITGSKINTDYEKLQLALKPFFLKKAAFQAELNTMSVEKKNDKATMSEKMKNFIPIMNELLQVYCDFIKSNTSSYLSLDLLKEYGDMDHDYTKVAPLFNALSEELKNTEHGKEYAAVLKKILIQKTADSLSTQMIMSINVAIGEMAPKFTQNDPDGKPIKLSDFKGKYVLVDFWASGCGSCRGANPKLVKTYTKYHDKGFEILGVSGDYQKKAWIKAINDDKLPWKQVSDLKGWKNEAFVLYGIKAMPRAVLIDPNGRVISTDILNYNDLDNKLAELLK